MPGVSTRNAIQCNHSRMVQAEAKAGAIEGNPIREDIDEVCERFVPITFIVNVILDEKKRIRRCVAGHFIKAHRGLPLSGSALQNPDSPPGRHRNRFCRRISQGYQSLPGSEGSGQRKACGKGRWLYSLGCLFERGTGRRSFEKWMTGHEKAHDMIEHISREFQLGGHKAAAIAMVLEKADIYLYSDMDADFVRSIHLKPCQDLQAELDSALSRYGENASVIVMPYGGSTLPCTK